MGTQAQSAPYSNEQTSALEREQLILDHLTQVRWIAIRIYEKLPGATNLEDLISTGIIGLINAVDNFDPTYNVKLRTYAECKIRGAILDSVRGLDGVPSHHRKKLRRIGSAIFEIEQRLMRPPTDEEIAAELGIDVEEYRRWLQDVQGVTVGSLDVISDNGEGVSLLRYVADNPEDQPSRILERAELEKLLAEGVEKMPQLERTILDLYYRQGLNLREIAEIYGFHVTRVSQLKVQAVLRLRSYMQRLWPTHTGGL